MMKVVDHLPEPRRSIVKQRFIDARRRLEAEAPALLDLLLHPQDRPRDQLASLGDDYFRLGIACPFLENESCSIYADRPVDCRQYLVVSPARHCAEHNSPHVRAITPWGGPVEWVVLALAPDFVSEHPAEPPPRAGPEIVEEFFARFGRVAPDAPPE